MRSLLPHILTQCNADNEGSEPLAALLEINKLSRPQVVKQLWVYIKDNSLQNPSNKREIMCDDQLRAVFGVDKIDMFKMNKVLGQYVPILDYAPVSCAHETIISSNTTRLWSYACTQASTRAGIARRSARRYLSFQRYGSIKTLDHRISQLNVCDSARHVLSPFLSLRFAFITLIIWYLTSGPSSSSQSSSTYGCTLLSPLYIIRQRLNLAVTFSLTVFELHALCSLPYMLSNNGLKIF